MRGLGYGPPVLAATAAIGSGTALAQWPIEVNSQCNDSPVRNFDQGAYDGGQPAFAYTARSCREHVYAPAGTLVKRLRAGVTGQQTYFSELLIDVNCVLRVVPIPLTTAIIASAMPAAIRPYSMAVAPFSSERKFDKIRFNTASLEWRCGSSISPINRTPKGVINGGSTILECGAGARPGRQVSGEGRQAKPCKPGFSARDRILRADQDRLRLLAGGAFARRARVELASPKQGPLGCLVRDGVP